MSHVLSRHWSRGGRTSRCGYWAEYAERTKADCLNFTNFANFTCACGHLWSKLPIRSDQIRDSTAFGTSFFNRKKVASAESATGTSVFHVLADVPLPGKGGHTVDLFDYERICCVWNTPCNCHVVESLLDPFLSGLSFVYIMMTK